MTDRDRPQGNSESVSDGYFTTLGLKILEGRDFTIEDNDAKQPVAIVNASFARKYWGTKARSAAGFASSIRRSRSRGARSSALCPIR